MCVQASGLPYLIIFMDVIETSNVYAVRLQVATSKWTIIGIRLYIRGETVIINLYNKLSFRERKQTPRGKYGNAGF